MKIITLVFLLAAATAALAIPLPQACNPAIAKVRRTDPPSILVSDLISSDPCLPSTSSVNTDSTRTKTSSLGTSHAESFSSWLHRAWNKIRDAISKLKITIKIPLDVLGDWINKIANKWTVMTDPSVPDGQGVILIPPPDDPGAVILHWRPPPITLPPTKQECGGSTPPGKPVKLCP